MHRGTHKHAVQEPAGADDAAQANGNTTKSSQGTSADIPAAAGTAAVAAKGRKLEEDEEALMTPRKRQRLAGPESSIGDTFDDEDAEVGHVRPLLHTLILTLQGGAQFGKVLDF